MPRICTTGTPRRIDVDSTWILRRYVKDQISTNFQSFPRTFFDVISLVETSTLFSSTFFDVISMVEKSTLFSLTFLNVILMVEKCTLFARTFCDEIWTGRNLTSFLVKLQANKKHSRRFSFVSNFKKLIFAKFFSLDFSSKSPWCRPFSIQMWDLQLSALEKEPPQFSFLSICRTTTLLHNFWTATLQWNYSCKKV